MVEFAIIAPLLFLLLFGVIDFGWLLNQQQDVRYGAREGARIAAVSSQYSATPSAKSIVKAVCERMDSSTPDMRVSIVATPTAPSTTVQIGDLAKIQVWKPAQDITGFFTDVIGDSVIKSNLTFRLEQQPGGWGTDPELRTPLSESGGTITGGITCAAAET